MTKTAHHKRAALHTLGCRLNQAETTLIAERLEAAGYRIVPFDAEADLGIVNTCTVTAEADAKSRQMLRRFIRRNPAAFTAAVGCYSQVGFREIEAIQGIDLILGNQEKLNVLDYVTEGKNRRPLIVRDHIERADFAIETNSASSVERRANLKIQDGCDFMCAFCVIPMARGRARSRRLDNLVEEARQLAARGAKEIVLTGVNLGSYAFEGKSIVDVVDALNGIEDVARIRISSIEPTTIPEGIIERMADPAHALVPYLHIPVQSGSDRVLDLMKRRYTRAEFVQFITRAADAIPGLCVGTDVLVGMPGETEADFEATCSVLGESPVAYAHVFKYSERKNTAASRMSAKVDSRTIDKRSAQARDVSARKRKAFYKHCLGQSVEVLFENQVQGYWRGLTGNYIRVAVRSQESLGNTIRRVHIERVGEDAALGVLDDND
jgi:threonylcarbamoyladenosine tRNA methylthiotransferase MtaB